jgi:hypothetical protein
MTKSDQNYLENLIKKLLTPVIKFGVKRSFKLQDFIEFIKQVFVELGIEELKDQSESISVSRISIMTGVHRRDVTRIINSDGTPDQSESLVGKILGQWRTDPRFKNKLGNPAILSFKGANNDFSRLVSIISKELNPGVIIKELLRIGAVKKEKLGLKLLTPAYIPNPQSKENLSMLAKDSADLFRCIEENCNDQTTTKNLHIKTEFDNIPDEFIDQLKLWCLEEGTKFHQRLEQHLSKFDKDTNPSIIKLPGKNKVSVASFSVADLLDI